MNPLQAILRFLPALIAIMAALTPLREGRAASSSESDEKAKVAEGRKVTAGLVELAKDLQKFEGQLTKAIGSKDDAQVAKLLKRDEFAVLEMTSPGFILAVAAREHNYTVLDALVKNHADIDARPYGGNTALHMAVWRDDREMVKYLLDHGADPFRIGTGYETAVDGAFLQMPKRSRTGSVQLVLSHLKKAGELDLFLQWEKMLAQVRSRGMDAGWIAQQNACLAEIQKMAAEAGN
jgi:hypothetical protein